MVLSSKKIDPDTGKYVIPEGFCENDAIKRYEKYVDYIVKAQAELAAIGVETIFVFTQPKCPDIISNAAKGRIYATHHGNPFQLIKNASDAIHSGKVVPLPVIRSDALPEVCGGSLHDISEQPMPKITKYAYDTMKTASKEERRPCTYRPHRRETSNVAVANRKEKFGNYEWDAEQDYNENGVLGRSGNLGKLGAKKRLYEQRPSPTPTKKYKNITVESLAQISSSDTESSQSSTSNKPLAPVSMLTPGCVGLLDDPPEYDDTLGDVINDQFYRGVVMDILNGVHS